MEYNEIKVLDYTFFVAKNQEGITYIDTNNHFKKCFKNQIPTKTNNEFIDVKKQLEEYFLGKRKEFSFKYTFIGTPFSKKVWEILKDVPYGKTVTYSYLAEQLGDVKKVRAVANAVGRNPLLIVVPCHRVIGKDGKLHGFRAGLETKRLLLDIEKGNNL